MPARFKFSASVRGAAIAVALALLLAAGFVRSSSLSPLIALVSSHDSAFMPSAQRPEADLIGAALLRLSSSLWAYVPSTLCLCLPALILLLVCGPRLKVKSGIYTLCGFWFAGVLALHLWVVQEPPVSSDEFTYLFQSKILMRGELWTPAPPESDYFNGGGTFVLSGKWLAPYQIGWPLCLALGGAFDFAWMVNPLIGAACLLAVYHLSRELFGRSAARYSALLFVACPMFALNAASYQIHPLVALLQVSTLLFYLRSLRRGLKSSSRPAWTNAVLAGLAFGFLLLVRFPEFVCLAPMMVFFSWHSLRQPNRGLESLKTVAVFLASSSPWLLVLMAVNWVQTGDPLLFAFRAAHPLDGFGFGGAWGHTPAKAFYHLMLTFAKIVTWITPLGLELAAVGLLFNRRRRENLAAAGLLLGCLMNLTMYALFFGTEMVSFGPRYQYPTVLFAVVLGGRGLQWIFVRLRGKTFFNPSLALIAWVAFSWTVAGSISMRIREQSLGHQFPRIGLERAIPGKLGLVFVRKSLDDRPDDWLRNDPLLQNRLVFVYLLEPERNLKLAKLFPNRVPLILDQTEESLGLKAYQWDGLSARERSDNLLYAARHYSLLAQVERAKELSRQAIETDPSFYFAHSFYAAMLESDGDLRGATRELELALQMASDKHKYRLELGRIYFKLGEPELARKHLTLVRQESDRQQQRDQAAQLLESNPKDR